MKGRVFPLRALGDFFLFRLFHYSGCFITLCNLHCGERTISTAEIEGNNKSAFVENIKDIISLGAKKERGSSRREMC